MIRFLYNTVFTIGFLLVWPHLLYRMWKRGQVWRKIGERFSIYERGTIRKLASFQEPLWIHAVSVGEIKMAIPLINEIRKKRPHQDVVLTTTTVTGRRIGEEIRDDHTLMLYHPLDLCWCVRKAFRLIRPQMLILVDQELWPNHLWEAKASGVPVWVVNARMSDRSMKRFRTFRGLLRPLLRELNLVCLQMNEDVERYRRAGFPPHRLFVTGSLKFDVGLQPGESEMIKELREQTSWSANELILLAGSTHSGEEKILIEQFCRMKPQYPDLRLVLVPRHVERTPEIVELVENAGLSYIRRTDVVHSGSTPDVFIVNTTGELAHLYHFADINFIGKSLCGKGGQNFIEAARAGKPVLFGPEMSNFRDLLRLFKAADAILQIKDEDELETMIRELISSPAKRKKYGDAAAEVCQQHAGTKEKLSLMIAQALS